jgi:ATP-binding cassette subfamily F protein uup
LLLARILKNGGNFLILDEPTNDLDLATLRVLEEALLTFDGVVVVVSHDRYFLNRVCTGILAFEGEGKVAYSEGNYDYYLEKKQRAAAAQAGQAGKDARFSKSEARVESSERKATPGSAKPRKLSFKEARELEGMESAIAEVEGEIARIENLFLDPDFNRKYGQQMNELNEQLAEQKEKLNSLFARWEELEAIRAGAAPAEAQ